METQKQNTFTLRLPPELMDWVRQVASEADRSINSQLARIVKLAREAQSEKVNGNRV